MKAIGYQTAGAISRPDALVDIELEAPVPGPRDLLVRVRAVSVNPVDSKIRQSVSAPEGSWKVLGWDASGVVEEVGAEVTGFAPGDEVYYAGALNRPGTNSELHLVDARLAGHKPRSLGHAEAAALPLTAITAWEMLFDRLEVQRPVPGAAPVLLIIGGAGGVGSIAIRLARAMTGLTVVATASRPESTAWALECGAHHVLDHGRALPPQLAELGLGAPGWVFSTTRSEAHAGQIAELIAPQGRFGLIDDPVGLVIDAFKRKSVSIHWELMFTRSLYETADMQEQGALLDRLAGLIDEGRVGSTLTQVLRPISAANLKRAHDLIETGRALGKTVLEGFGPDPEIISPFR